MTQTSVINWQDMTDGSSLYAATADYAVGALCALPGGELYIATQPSGPSYGGAKPPPDSAFWRVATTDIFAVTAGAVAIDTIIKPTKLCITDAQASLPVAAPVFFMVEATDDEATVTQACWSKATGHQYSRIGVVAANGTVTWGPWRQFLDDTGFTLKGPMYMETPTRKNMPIDIRPVHVGGAGDDMLLSCGGQTFLIGGEGLYLLYDSGYFKTMSAEIAVIAADSSILLMSNCNSGLAEDVKILKFNTAGAFYPNVARGVSLGAKGYEFSEIHGVSLVATSMPYGAAAGNILFEGSGAAATTYSGAMEIGFPPSFLGTRNMFTVDLTVYNRKQPSCGAKVSIFGYLDAAGKFANYSAFVSNQNVVSKIRLCAVGTSKAAILIDTLTNDWQYWAVRIDNASVHYNNIATVLTTGWTIAPIPIEPEWTYNLSVPINVGFVAASIPALPKLEAEIGQWTSFNTTLPAGGSWVYHWTGFDADRRFLTSKTSKAAGGTDVSAGTGAAISSGFCWRIS